MDLTSTIKEWLPRVKEWSSHINWKNLFLFFVFFVLAFIFWLMLFFQRDIEATYQIPLKYTNIPEDVVFNKTPPEYIEVRLADKGSEVFRYDFMLHDSLVIDVENYKKDNINIIQGNLFLQLIRTPLSSSTNIRGYTPGSISLETSKLQKKTLRVVFDGDISTSRSNLIADSISFIPETITAYGSKEKLSELENAKTEYTTFSNLKATSQLKAKIKEIEGVKFAPKEIDVLIPIFEFTERKIDIPITAHNVPENKSVKFFPSQIEVSFSVTLEDYKKISPEDFKIELNYNQFYNIEDGKVDLILTKKPKSIRNIRLSPSSVEFLFENN